MDNWLVCFAVSLPEMERLSVLAEAGAQVLLGGETVPLGDEVAVRVEADRKTIAALRKYDVVCGIFPDSDPVPY